MVIFVDVFVRDAVCLESLHKRTEIFLGCQLNADQCRTEILVRLADVLDVHEVIGRAYYVADE